MPPAVLRPQFGPSQAVTRTAQKTSAVTRAIEDKERIGLSAVAVDAERLSQGHFLPQGDLH